MSKPPRGLGRGLGALLGDAPPAVAQPQAGGLVQVPVAAIRPNPRQPRTIFNAEAMAELERSIAALGVLVPIIVRPLGGTPSQYELVAGERRWRAASAVRLETIPAIVRQVDSRESLEVAVVENLQRANLDPIEEAMGFANLMEEYEYTQERLAERLGRSRPAVANALRLLALPDSVKAELREGRLTIGHAKAILAFPEAERVPMALRAVREGSSVRELERLAARRKERAEPRRFIKGPDIEAAEESLRFRLGAAVAIVPGTRGGRIEIRYSTPDELIRIADLLLGEP
jgi:ParB family chromosome partitioning protein